MSGIDEVVENERVTYDIHIEQKPIVDAEDITHTVINKYDLQVQGPSPYHNTVWDEVVLPELDRLNLEPVDLKKCKVEYDGREILLYQS
jgi:hypothetical protein